MRYRVCDMGHIHKDGTGWECPICCARLFESDAITALCRRLEGKPEGGVYRIVECTYGDERVLNIEGRDAIVQGPISNALVVTIPNDWMRSLVEVGRLSQFMEHTKETLRSGGWKGEVLLFSDKIKLARFEPVEGES